MLQVNFEATKASCSQPAVEPSWVGSCLSNSSLDFALESKCFLAQFGALANISNHLSTNVQWNFLLQGV